MIHSNILITVSMFFSTNVPSHIYIDQLPYHSFKHSPYYINALLNQSPIRYHITSSSFIHTFSLIYQSSPQSVIFRIHINQFLHSFHSFTNHINSLSKIKARYIFSNNPFVLQPSNLILIKSMIS